MLDLTGTDTKGQGTKGTVCGGVAVTADNSGTWQSESLLRTNNVDDSLSLVAQTKIC